MKSVRGGGQSGEGDRKMVPFGKRLEAIYSLLTLNYTKGLKEVVVGEERLYTFCGKK